MNFLDSNEFKKVYIQENTMKILKILGNWYSVSLESFLSVKHSTHLTKEMLKIEKQGVYKK